MRTDDGSAFRLALAAGSLALAAGLFGGLTLSGTTGAYARFPTLAGSQGGGITLSDAGRRVASGMKCLCGCPDILIACGCANYNGATEIKRFIMQQLGAGKAEAEVRMEVVAKYGARIEGGGR